MRGSARMRKGAGIFAAVGAIALTVGLARSATRDPQQDLVTAADREKTLLIYSATDRRELAGLLDVFRRRYPHVTVDYRSLRASEVYDRFRAEAQAGTPTADLVINSAMDLQIKLVNDGFAQSYRSPQRGALPDWAVWKDEAFAVTAEPIVIGFNRHKVPAGLVPRSHDDLASILHRNPGAFRGRIGLYDPALSPTGMLYITQDIQTDRDSWDLISAIGREQPRLYRSAQAMMNDVSAGRLLVAYNLIGSYAFERAATDPAFGVVVPDDYALVMSRVALIAKNAAHPAAARLFLDFMLSREGQRLLAKRHMTPLRDDIAQPGRLTGANIRAIRVGPALMASIDTVNRENFLKKWRASIGSGDRRAEP